MKRTKMIFGALLIFSLMIGSAFAGQTYVNHAAGGANYAIAHEVLGQTRAITIGSPGGTNALNSGNVAVGFRLGQSLTSGSLLNLNLDSALQFQSSSVTYSVCAQNDFVPTLTDHSKMIGSAPGSASSNITVVLNATTANALVSAGNLLYITTASCANANNSAANFNVVANAPVGTKLITGSIVIGSATVDPDSGGGANAVRVVNEFTTNLSANDLTKIDYLSTPYDGTHVISNLTVGASNIISMSPNKLVANRTSSTLNYQTGPASGALNGSVTLGQVVNLTDSANWQGVSKVYLTGDVNDATTNLTAGNCLSGNVIANNTSPSGNLTLTSSGNFAFNGTKAATTTICIQVAGNVPLASRTISGDYAYTASSGGLAPSGQTGQIFQLWMPNGYQSFQPYMYVGSSDADDVFVRLYNNSTRDAIVYAEVFPNAGGASQTLTLGTITANSAGLYWARTIGASAGYSAGTSYAARFTVTAPMDKVNGVSFMKRTSGGERSMPLYKNDMPGFYLYE